MVIGLMKFYKGFVNQNDVKFKMSALQFQNKQKSSTSHFPTSISLTSG